jgi:hypothetical protein
MKHGFSQNGKDTGYRIQDTGTGYEIIFVLS